MSYARFSSDDFKSDVYVYRHISGNFQIHVASSRHQIDRSKLPEKPNPDDDDFGQKLAERHTKVIELVDGAPTEDIGGPLDGENYAEPTREATLSRLKEIKDKGYFVPDNAIRRLKEEIQQTEDA